MVAAERQRLHRQPPHGEDQVGQYAHQPGPWRGECPADSATTAGHRPRRKSLAARLAAVGRGADARATVRKTARTRGRIVSCNSTIYSPMRAAAP